MLGFVLLCVCVCVCVCVCACVCVHMCMHFPFFATFFKCDYGQPSGFLSACPRMWRKENAMWRQKQIL